MLKRVIDEKLKLMKLNSSKLVWMYLELQGDESAYTYRDIKEGLRIAHDSVWRAVTELRELGLLEANEGSIKRKTPKV